MSSKIGLILKREYLTRVKKKTFIIMTILGPILFAALVIAPTLLMKWEQEEFHRIAVIDESGFFEDVLPNTNYLEFDFVSAKYYDPVTSRYNVEQAKKDIEKSDYFGLLYIPHTAVMTNKGTVELSSVKQASSGLIMHIGNSIEKRIEDVKLSHKTEELGISEDDVTDILKVVNTNINVVTSVIKDGHEKQTFSKISGFLGVLCGLLIYMFVFMYGNQVMQGVIEEKSNRIIEVIVSSVKPFQLMMGKILGVALVGLTQFLLWVVLTFGLVVVGQSLLFDKNDVANLTSQTMNIGSQLGMDTQIENDNMAEIEEVVNSVLSQDYFLILVTFLFYFLFGYLLYAAMFAAIGSAVDNEADTQQFMLPITVPLLLGLFVTFSVFNNPEGNLAYWFSIIPFTSPIVMMARIPFGLVPVSDLIISMGLLVLTFILMTWFAAKIYRVGILMYGKKVTYKELWKWFKYKN